MSGVGIGAILVPQIVRALIDTPGWCVAYLGVDALTFAVPFPRPRYPWQIYRGQGLRRDRSAPAPRRA
jgi:hypothetical protein